MGKAKVIGGLSYREIIERVIPYSKEIERLPNRINDDLISILIKEGLAFTGSRDPTTLSKEIDDIDENQFVILPLEHRLTKSETDSIIKKVSPENYLYLNSAPVIRDAINESRKLEKIHPFSLHLPDIYNPEKPRLTDALLEATDLYPYFLIKSAVFIRGKTSKIPPIGFYWVGNDGRPKFTTWMRLKHGLDLYRKWKKNSSYVQFIDKKFYGHNVSIRVRSIDESSKTYTFDLTNLPILKEDDRKQMSYWRKIEPVGHSCPDYRYRADLHDKRSPNEVLFCYHSIGAYYALADRLRETHECGAGLEIAVNMLPFPTKRLEQYINKLLTQAIIGRDVLNMTEMDKSIGAKLIREFRNYDNNLYNWTNQLKYT